jgi:hypothetical protein
VAGVDGSKSRLAGRQLAGDECSQITRSEVSIASMAILRDLAATNTNLALTYGFYNSNLDRFSRNLYRHNLFIAK